jgi:uncharacterized protein YebE (UPF0316 family)
MISIVARKLRTKRNRRKLSSCWRRINGLAYVIGLQQTLDRSNKIKTIIAFSVYCTTTDVRKWPFVSVDLKVMLCVHTIVEVVYNNNEIIEIRYRPQRELVPLQTTLPGSQHN